VPWGKTDYTTQTDILIQKDSSHPYEHEISSVNYLTNRLLPYYITKEAKEKQRNIIQEILHNNEYSKNLSTRQPNQHKHNKNTYKQKKKKKGAIFTYSGKETKNITKLFKETQIGIAFRTRNTVQNVVKPCTQIDRHGRNGVYRMKCMDCQLKYVGLTGRTFYIRYKEQIQTIGNNNVSSGYWARDTNTKYNWYNGNRGSGEKRKTLEHIR
jgi:hypothetical protein